METFKDCRGEIYKTEHVNIITTVKGAMRSGDFHPSDQYDCVIKGTVRITTTLGDKVYGKGKIFRIPAGVPHLFYSVTDSVVAEWWDGEFDCEYYPPFRTMVDEYIKSHGVADGT